MMKRFTTLKRLGVVLALMTFLVSQANAQRANVSGRVISAEDSQPLPGVSIVIKGTTSGTVTDSDGNYTVAVEKGSVLVFSFLGMESQEVTIEDQTRLDLSLQ